MPLMYFLGGYLFASIIYPILEGLCELLLTKMEVPKTKAGKDVVEIQAEAQKLMDECGGDTRVVGFCADDEEEEPDEEEDI